MAQTNHTNGGAYDDEPAKTASNGNESRRKNVQGDRRGNRRDAGSRKNVYVPLQKSEGEKEVRDVQSVSPHDCKINPAVLLRQVQNGLVEYSESQKPIVPERRNAAFFIPCFCLGKARTRNVTLYQKGNKR